MVVANPDCGVAMRPIVIGSSHRDELLRRTIGATSPPLRKGGRIKWFAELQIQNSNPTIAPN